ncbi:MAG: helix-turn-helix transcriptional regulator [Nitrospinales bacterium]
MANTNSVRQIREAKMMSKAELARKADVTVQTIDRIEKGNECRLDTKRKIILALGYKLADRTRIFEDDNGNPNTLSNKSYKKKG